MANVNCIDVSSYQKNVDYAKVKAAGITAVIIRAGYGNTSAQKDKQFETHYKNAKAAGLNLGAYWYSYAATVAEAKKEAAACLSCITGKTFDLPVYYDMEDSSIISAGKAALTNVAKTFCEAIKTGGYSAGVYANLNWFKNYLDYSALKSKYSIWLAQYSAVNEKDCDIWQNSSTGSVDGISGNVDTDVIYNSGLISSSSSVTSGASSSVSKSSSAAPDVTYRVRTGGKWLPEVKNLEDYAGIVGKAITDIAIKVSKGSVKYRVHVKGGSWLPYVTGYSTGDSSNGYAGNGKAIDAVEVYYTTPSDLAKLTGYFKAKYRVSPLNGGYYSYQYDNEKTSSQDGYAGSIGTAIDRFQAVLSL